MVEIDEASSRVHGEYVRRSGHDFMFFVRGLTVPSEDEDVFKFSRCMQDFQRETFEDLAPSLRALQTGKKPPRQRFWIERTKKAGKDSDLAAVILWLMAFPARPFKIQVVAANRNQARIIENRAVDYLHYNPWLKKKIEIVQGIIRSRQRHREAWTHIEATESGGAAHGETPDLLVLNELVHVKRWGVMEAHRNNADGVPRGMVIISTNAGFKSTPAWTWRELAKQNPDVWSMHVWSVKAPWIPDEFLAEARRRDPIGTEFRRLWDGEWVSGAGGSVSEEDLDECFCLDGPGDPEPGWIHMMGLDMGETHDHSGVVVLGIQIGGRMIRVKRFKAFTPNLPNSQGKMEVDEAAVTSWCEKMALKYSVASFGYDPAAGGRFVAQKIRRMGIPTFEVSFASPANLTAMAVAFVQTVSGAILECYDDGEGRLRRDFGKFTIVPKVPGGYRLTAVSDEHGHADIGTALVILLPKALQFLGGAGIGSDNLGLIYAGEEKLSEEDQDKMAPDLRELYDLG